MSLSRGKISVVLFLPANGLLVAAPGIGGVMFVASLFDLARAGTSLFTGEMLRWRACLCCWDIREGCDCPRVWADFKRRRARWEFGDGGAWRRVLEGGRREGVMGREGILLGDGEEAMAMEEIYIHFAGERNVVKVVVLKVEYKCDSLGAWSLRDATRVEPID